MCDIVNIDNKDAVVKIVKYNYKCVVEKNSNLLICLQSELLSTLTDQCFKLVGKFSCV